MSNLKDELNNIDIPSELRSRSRAGIERAIQERKPKKRWLPTALTAIITAAIVFFIASAIANPSLFTRTTSGSATKAVLIEGRPLHQAYIVAAIVTIVIVASVYIALRKYRHYKKWILLCTTVVLVWNWNVAHYKASQLSAPVVMPIYFEMLEGTDSMLFVNYIVNNDEEEHFIHRLNIDGVEMIADSFEYEEGKTIHEQERLVHHVSKQASFRVFNLNIAQIEQVDLSNSYALFENGDRVKVKIEKFSFVKNEEGEKLPNSKAINSDSSYVDTGTGGGAQFEINPTVIHTVHLPEIEGYPIRYEVKVGDTVIKRFAYKELPNIDLLPYEVEEPQLLEMNYELNRAPDHLTTYAFPIIIYGVNEFYVDYINDHLFIDQEDTRYILHEEE